MSVLDLPTCFDCRNKENFLQVVVDRAGILRERRISMQLKVMGRGQPPNQETVKHPWRLPNNYDGKRKGFFCGNCLGAVEIEPEFAEYLSDLPASFIDPTSFKADPFVQRIRETLIDSDIYVHESPARDAKFSNLKHHIERPLVESLENQRINSKKLYAHQVKAIDATLSGTNVIISTSAASGKTLCFNIPVLNSVLKDQQSHALYIYPTKALAQDQILKILKFDEDYSDEKLGSQKGSFFRFSIGGVRMSLGKYDGATSNFERTVMREKEHPNILITNPDMLHTAILRNNLKWERFFSGLKFIVLDEIHSYKGIFGSNVSLVLRRLRAICEFRGSNPQFILCSATIGNPLEHAKALTGLSSFTVIEEDSSPSQARKIVMINPPLLRGEQANRHEPSTIAIDILSRVLLREKKAVKTIIFGRSRLSVKNMYRFLNARLREDSATKDMANLTREYTATLTPEKREEIGKDLAMGNIVAIVGTNALELGIDIGDINAAVAVGYPGSTASLIQEFGRAGRKGEGLGLLLMQNNPLEQYYARHPKEFFDKSPEIVKINPQNEFLLSAHLLCSSYETESYGGLGNSELKKYFRISSGEAKKLIGDEGAIIERLRNSQVKLVWKSGEPVYNSLRNPISKSNFDIMWNGTKVGVMDEATVIRDLHPEAVWTDQDEQYVVSNLDFRKKIAEMEKKEVEYYTVAIPVDNVSIDDEIEKKKLRGAVCSFGKMRLRRSIFSYKKVYLGGTHKDEKVQLKKTLPSAEFLTTASWISFRVAQSKTLCSLSSIDLDGGLHALEHAIVSMLPRYVDCDPNDISGFSDISSSAVGGQPVVFTYDNFPGGIGLSNMLYEKLPEVIESCISLIDSCGCSEDGGCPACIQSVRCHQDNRPLSKRNAVILARAVGHVKS